jgi:membrane protein implicated in regulation of membrane protease activity
MNHVFYWITAALLCTLFELGTPGLFWFLSFSIGSFIAASAAWFGFGLDAQLISFLCGVFIGFVILRKYSKNLVKNAILQTNVGALQGKVGVVIEVILPYQVGQVNLNGEIWSARSLHDESTLVDTLVEVVRVSGCHLIVRKK